MLAGCGFQPLAFFFLFCQPQILMMTGNETSFHEKFVVLVIAAIMIALFIKIIFF